MENEENARIVDVASAAPVRRPTAWAKRIVWVMGTLLLLFLIVWLGLPPLLKWQVPLRASEALGRPVSIGAVTFKPWYLEFDVDDVRIAGLPAETEPLLRIARVHADLSAKTFIRLAPVVEALDVDGLQVRVARTSEGHYDIDDLIERLKPKPEPPDAKPTGSARFALYNLQVKNASLRFDDQPVGRVQTVDQLQLAVPFVSNFPAQVEIKVEPRLSFRLNGTTFNSGGEATPFAKARRGEMKLAVDDLDLAPYLGYQPASLPVRLTRGSISAHLDLNFEAPETTAPSAVLKGSIGAKNLALAEAGGARLIESRDVAVDLQGLQMLARKLAVGSVKIDGLVVHATRDNAGRINLLNSTGPSSPEAKPPAPRSAMPPATAVSAASGAEPAGSAAVQTAPAWQVEVDQIQLTDGRVLWNDAAVNPAAAMQLADITLSASRVDWPLTKPIPWTLKADVRQQAAGAAVVAGLSAEGAASAKAAEAAIVLTKMSLAAFAPYLPPTLVPTIDGTLDARAHIDWSGAAGAPRLVVAVKTLALDDFRLSDDRGRTEQPAVSLQQLTVADATIDLLGHRVALGNVAFKQPAVSLARDKRGRLNVQDWIAGSAAKPAASATPVDAAASAVASGASAVASTAASAASSGAAAAASAAADHTAAPETSAAPWHLALKSFQLDGGRLRFADAMAGAGAPVQVELTELHLTTSGVDWQVGTPPPPLKLELGARIGAPSRDKARPAGSIDYTGQLGAQPVLMRGRLVVHQFPVTLFAPYFAAQIPVALLRAEAGYTGTVSVAQQTRGFDIAVDGDALIGNVHVASKAAAAAPGGVGSSGELLSWQSLALKTLKVEIKPAGRPQIELGEAAIDDFFSQLIITEQGQFNLEDLNGGKPTDEAAPEVAANAASAASAASPVSAPAITSAKPLPFDLTVDATRLNNGRIDFTDHFVKPNYSAALTELNGSLGTFGTGTSAMAKLELTGRAAGTAMLEISGELNPLARPLALDIRARATDLELAPLSPYAAKYAGYDIARGKLSMDVSYKIDPNGELQAKNKLVLNQLTFGEKVESKDATTLPVRLAIALLKNRNGVIDLNLPISGSLRDPQFSITGILVQVLENVLTKAITSPFSLLTGGGSGDGGGDGKDLSQVEFEPGTAQITPAGKAAVDKVAKALEARPALKMTITGEVDPVAERTAFERASLDSRLVAEKRRQAVADGKPATAAAPSAAPDQLSAAERGRLLTELYENSDLPDKPRNFLGFAKDVPAAQMESLLNAHRPATPEAMRELALQRGIAVRDALVAQGLSNTRLFLAAPKVHSADAGGKAWVPIVQLSLSVQ